MKNSIVPHLWTLALILYLGRSLAEPIKYLFIVSFGLLIISYGYYFIKGTKHNSIVRFLFFTKEFQVLGLFLVLGILLSSQLQILSIKSLVNFIGITVFFWIYLEYKEQIQLIRFFRGWIILTVIIGTIGILKWLFYILELNIEWFWAIYPHGSSLVSDYNFYASFFLISIVIYLYALNKEIIQEKLITNQAILFLFITNIVLTGSRRGIIVLALFILLALLFMLLKRKKKYNMFFRNLACTNILIFSLLFIFVALIPFRSKIITESSTRFKITASVYRYSTLFIPNITYRLFYDKLWPKTATYQNDKTNWEKYSTYNNLVNEIIENKYQDLKNEYWLDFDEKSNTKNLFYNGNLEYGLKLWEINSPDRVEHEIIATEYGNAIRVTRFDGKGYWPLEYRGREIVYHKGLTYTFKFKCRVIQGRGIPFKIGWWINEGDGFKNNLDFEIRDLGNGWFEYAASYKFKNDQRKLQTFMNSQQANTTVDFADIELTSDDTLNRPNYLDQLFHFEGNNLLYNSNFENGLTFWGTMTPDSIIHKLVDTEYGKAVRVTRKVGEGYWPLIYRGRDLYYYKDLTYHFRFKFRVIEGAKAPFYIGWWPENEKPKPYNLQKNIFPINDEWFECQTSYTFKNDHYGNIPTFMNGQKANTIIEFTDIELLCDDSINRSMYADEKIDVLIALEEARIKQLLGKERAGIIYARAIRWKYALELWQSEYTWSNKLFGKGFDYLAKYGQKFYPDMDRVDYPHNPIISAFLYSGIIGGLFYIYFLTLSFWYYWKYRKYHLIFFILYIITFTFILISSNSHFNVPIFAMLSLVPFFTRYMVNEKEKKSSVNI